MFERWGRMGLDHYARSGVSASVIPVKVREDAFNPEVVATVKGASMIYFSGGKPTRLADVLRDSPLLAAIRRAMDRGAVYAGCSAGAMIASRERNAGGRLGTSWLFGLGLVPNVSFGVHWDRAARIPGAQWWMTSRLPDDTWFVGIDERTATSGDGRSWTVFGLGVSPSAVPRMIEPSEWATGSRRPSVTSRPLTLRGSGGESGTTGVGSQASTRPSIATVPSTADTVRPAGADRFATRASR